MKDNNIIPLFSRKNTRVIYDDYISAINALNSRKIDKGEVFYIAYNSSLPNYNLPYKRTDIILAYGIENGEYQILNFCTSNLIYGVRDYPPPMEDLIQEQIFLYHNKTEDKWYLVFSPNGVTRKIQEIDAKPQTFIDIETGNLWVSYKDKKIRNLNEVCTQEETLAILGNLDFNQRDWKETNPEKISYIKNKPKLSDLGTLTYTIEREEQTKRTRYNLYWTEYNSLERILSGSIVLDEGKVLKSGVLDVVTLENKNLVPEDWEIGDKFLDLLISGYTDSHVYIYMEPLVDHYTSGDGGIEVNNNIVSVKVDTDSGLTSNISWRLATTSNNGAMSAEDHIKLSQFNPDLYATNTKLETGEIIAKTSSGTKNIVAPDSSDIIKESTGIITSTLFEQTYIQDKARIDNLEITETNPNLYNVKIISTGANLYNPENTKTGFKIDSNGDIIEDANYSLVFVPGIKNKVNTNFNEPIYDNGYVVSEDNSVVGFGDNLNSTSLTLLNKTTTLYGTETYIIPEENKILFVSLMTKDLENFYIRFAWSGEKAAEYEEYEENILDLSDYTLAFFPGYSVRSEFIDNNGELDFINILDKTENAEELIWTQEDTTTYSTTNINLELNAGDTIGLIYKTTGDNVLPCVYSQETANSGKITLTTSTVYPGTLYYPKTEETINTGIKSEVKINGEGMEYLVVENIQNPTSPVYYLKQTIKPDLIEQLDNFRHDMRTKLGRGDIENTVSGTSENPVQNKVLKEYIDSVISARQDIEVKDLSRFDIFGMPNTGMTTANCYVIYETGTYKIPLVYGNAIKNGTNNTQAYVAGKGENMTNFVNCFDKTITSPYIETDTNTTASRGLVVWQETERMITNLELISGEDCKYLKFKVNSIPTLNSNAIIGVEDSSQNILWSWHIWVVYDIDELHPMEIKNSITTEGDTGSYIFNIMPVNLGFVKSREGSIKGTNPYYQWGRKDPMKRAASDTSSSGTLILYGERDFDIYGSSGDLDSTKTFGKAIKNPNLFFTEYSNAEHPGITTTPKYNWFAPVQNTAASTATIETPYNLWDSIRNAVGDNAGSVKSVYDPCPVGWKVPTRDTFRGFTTSRSSSTDDPNAFNVIGSFDYGWTFKKYFGDTTGTFFPASGYRSRASGGLGVVGTNGYYWSSASNSQTYAYSLVFGSSSVYPLYISYRANGFPVRPIFE